MIGKLKLLPKSWARSRYILAGRTMMLRIGLKYIKMMVYSRPLDTDIPVVETKVPVEVRVLVSAKDVNDRCYQGVLLASGDDPVQHNETLRRLDQGDICVVGIVGDKVAGFVWQYSQRRKYEPAIEREEIFDEDEVLLYDALVFPEFRGKRVNTKLLETLLFFVKFKNYLKARTYVQAHNVAQRKTFERLGLYPVKVITCLRVFKFKSIKEHLVSRRAPKQTGWNAA